MSYGSHQSAVEAAVVYCKPTSNAARVDGSSMNVGNKLAARPSIRLFQPDNGDRMRSLLYDISTDSSSPQASSTMPSARSPAAPRVGASQKSGEFMKYLINDEWLPDPTPHFGDLKPREEVHLPPRKPLHVATPPQHHHAPLSPTSSSTALASARTSTFARSAEHTLQSSPTSEIGPMRHILNNDPIPPQSHPLLTSPRRARVAHGSHTTTTSVADDETDLQARDYRSVASAMHSSRRPEPPRPIVNHDPFTHRAHDVHVRSPRTLAQAVELVSESTPGLSARVGQLAARLQQPPGFVPNVGGLGQTQQQQMTARRSRSMVNSELNSPKNGKISSEQGSQQMSRQVSFNVSQDNHAGSDGGGSGGGGGGGGYSAEHRARRMQAVLSASLDDWNHKSSSSSSSSSSSAAENGGSQTARRHVDASNTHSPSLSQYTTAALSTRGSGHSYSNQHQHQQHQHQQPTGLVRNTSGDVRMEMGDWSSYSQQYHRNSPLHLHINTSATLSSSLSPAAAAASNSSSASNTLSPTASSSSSSSFPSSSFAAHLSASSEDIMRQWKLKRRAADEMRRASDRGLAVAESLQQVADYNARVDQQTTSTTTTTSAAAKTVHAAQCQSSHLKQPQK